MKNLLAAIAFISSLQATASTPIDVWIDTAGQFDANRIYSGGFAASGAIEAQGSVTDAPRFTGAAIHITRTMITSDSEHLVFEINANHVKGLHAVPDWCPLPETIPSGTVLVPESGSWKVTYGTGKYAALKGTGSWAAWVVLDLSSGIPVPVSAYDCMQGKVQIN
jgi:hypothetical protein